MSDILTISTPAGSGDFLVLGLRGREQLNRLFEYRVDVVSNVVGGVLNAPEMPIVIDLLIGKQCDVKFTVFDEDKHLSGYVTHFERGESHGTYRRHEITLRPWLWFATRRRNSKVFQDKTVKDIVTEVVSEYKTDFEWRLVSAAAYPKLDYCVQYDETDFDFVSRLLERAGINYFFEHSEGKHTLVFADANSKFSEDASGAEIKWANAFNTDEEAMFDWKLRTEVRSAKAVSADHDFLATATELKGEKEVAMTVPPLGKLGESEEFEFPGDVVANALRSNAEATADAQASTKLTDRAKLLLESLNSLQTICTAKTNARGVEVGKVFTLTDHPDAISNGKPVDQNGEYVIVATSFIIEHRVFESEDLKNLPADHEGFLAEVVCVKKDGNPIRPEVTVRKPVMRGPQTALVVGASGNEIETDKHGRVKVQFFWDRVGTKNQDSSCWVRVATPWASKGYGMIALPRVGDEVVVDFIDGDPDRPLIVGSVWNDVSTPPFKLPDNATISGIRTRTSKEGTAETFNELRFEDKKDAEYVWLQAQKDFHLHVKKKAFEWIGEDQFAKTLLNRKESIGKDWALDVGENVMHNVGKDFHVTVAGDIFTKGDATWQIKLAKDLSVDIGGNYGYAVKGDTGIKGTGKLLLTSADEVHIKGGPKIVVDGTQIELKGSGGIVIDCSGGVTLKCGGSLVALTSGGVDIVGSIVNINSGGGGAGAGSATQASPAQPADAKKLEDISSAKASDYDKNFEDPYVKSQSA